jgi:acyl-CoA synthetase (AMP-forming)/AMP-acid ligase II
VRALHSLTFGSVLAEHGRGRPADEALVCHDVRLTFRQLDERVDRLAAAMRQRGAGEGVRVLWLAQNCHHAFETLLACARLGAVWTPVNWRQSPEEIAFVIDDAEPGLVFWQSAEVGDAASRARELASSGAEWIRHDDETYDELVAGGDLDSPLPDVDPSLPLLQMYTAAFEGRPNGALLNQTALLFQDLVLALAMGYSSQTVYLASGPLFHIWTFINAVATFHLGGKIVVARRVDAEELCRLIDAEGCTAGMILEPTRSQIVEVNRDRRYNLKSFRGMRGSDEWNELITVDNSPWATHPGVYGQTELVGLITMSALEGSLAGRSGRTTPVGQVKIVGPDDNELAPGEVGEIVCRGAVVMLGYHNRPELNVARQRSEWHHTNDLGRREVDGSITFIGPKTTMIKSAAENIYPAEVEACIATHPAVQEVCVIGVPDAKWTQSVKAVVVVKADQAVSADEIIEHCRARIASYKKPRVVDFAPSLPRTAAGTIDRRAVDDAFGGGGYPGTGGR